jgi:hypothetical protein
MAFGKKVKRVERDITEAESLEFKKETVNGYEVISPIDTRFIETVQVGFQALVDDKVRIANTGDYLKKEKDTWVFPLEVKKAFQQTFFEKRGAGYSSVPGGGLIGIPINVPLVVKFNSYGTQKIDKRPVKGWDLEEVWFNGSEYLPENEAFTDETKEAIFYISNKQIQVLMTTPITDNLSRALYWIVSANQDKFVSKYVTTYIDEPTETYIDADIDVRIGDDKFHFASYGRLCKNEFQIMFFFDFKDELLAELAKLGYKKRY